MPQIPLTYKIVAAAAWDVGNRSMRTAGRKVWDIDDYNAMATEFSRLYEYLDPGFAEWEAQHWNENEAHR